MSYDIDIFVESAKLVRSLTPNANPLVKALQGNLPYDYPGPYLKLHRPDGEIDIITAAACTEPGSVPWEFEGTTIMLDTPVETAVKKMFFRSSTFKIRDVFDLAAILDTGHEEELLLQMGFLADKIQLLQDRLAHLAPMYERLAAQDVTPTEEGRRWLKRTAVERVRSFLGC